MCPIDLAAHKWLQQSDFCPVPSDKSGEFVLVSWSDFKTMQLELLSSKWYTELPYTVSDQHWINSYQPRCHRLCKSICELDHRATMAILTAGFHRKSDGLHAVLIHTVKDHKPAEKVAFRPVHASSSPMLEGIMAWMNLIMDDLLAKFPHVLKSVDQFFRS